MSCYAGPFATHIRQLIDMVAQHCRPAEGEVLTLTKFGKNILQDGNPQANSVGNLLARERTNRMNSFEDQVFDKGRVQACLGKGAWFFGEKTVIKPQCGNECFWRFLGGSRPRGLAFRRGRGRFERYCRLQLIDGHLLILAFHL